MPSTSSSFATALCLVAVSVPAQQREAKRPVARGQQRVTLVKPDRDPERREKIVLLVEKLASGELTAAERAECKRMLLEMVGSSAGRAPREGRGSVAEVTVEVVEEEIVEEEEGDEGRGEEAIRWRVNRAQPVPAPTPARRPAVVRRWIQRAGEGEPETRVRYRMLREGEKKARDLALRARAESREAGEREVFLLRERAEDEGGAQRVQFEIEGLQKRLAEALEKVEGAVEVEYDVHVREERGEPRRGAWVFERGEGDERAVFEWVHEEHEEHGHHEREHEEHGHHEREYEEHGHHEHEHEEHGHHEREHEEHGHHEREHEEHGHHEREHEEHGHHEREHEERGHHEREHEERGHHEREHEERGHHEREHEERGHHEHEHEEHGHREHEHEEHGHHEREHEGHGHHEHEEMLEEAAEVVEELFETMEEMRQEIRELREMVSDLHRALRAQRESGGPREGAQRGGRGRSRRGRE